MKTITGYISVKFGLFGLRQKPLHKQAYRDEIRKHVLKACDSTEEHDYLRARKVIYEAGDAAISLIECIGGDPNKLADVRGDITVRLVFNEDYTAWHVDAVYGMQVSSAESPNFEEACEAKTQELLHRYGFKEETDTRQWIVSYRGMTAEMDSEKLEKFRTEVAPYARFIVQEKEV